MFFSEAVQDNGDYLVSDYGRLILVVIRKYRTAVVVGIILILYFLYAGVVTFVGLIGKDSSVPVTTSPEIKEVDQESLILPKSLFVEAAGAINNPGVYELPSGSRVIDLLKKGGPITNEVSERWFMKNVNLVQPLKDGQKVYIPFESDLEDTEIAFTFDLGDTLDDAHTEIENMTQDTQDDLNSQSDTKTTDTSLINVNQATKDELKSLSGIGDTYAGRIVDNRPYANLTELQKKAEIPKATLSKIQTFITY